MTEELHAANDRDRRRRRRALGYLCYIGGCIAAVATVLAAFALFRDDVHFWTGVIASIGLLLASIALLVHAEGFLQPDAQTVCAADPRPPVVYLRPFGEDVELTYDVISAGETTTTLTAKAEDFLLALNAVGPLVTIAEPDFYARLGVHPQGVARDFVGEGDWQARVQQLLSRAGMVVLAIGDSPGIEWEIAQVRQRVAPQDLLLYLPPRPVGSWTRKGRSDKQREIYEQFAPLVERHFDVDMPPFAEATHIIGFDANSQPVMIPGETRRSWFWTEHSRTAKAVQAQLEAVLARVRPGTDLQRYRLPGRRALWQRLCVTLGVVSAGILFGWADFGLGSGSAAQLGGTLLQLLPGLALVVGWVLIARHFRSRWVWIIPILLASATMLQTLQVLTLRFGWYTLQALLIDLRYQGLTLLVHAGYALAVLALGIGLTGRGSDQRP